MARKQKNSKGSSSKRSSRRGNDVSNRTVLALLLATLAISLGGTFISLSTINTRLSTLGLEPITGLALVPNATATLTIEQAASIRFTQATIAFGTGSVDTANGFNNCTLSTLEWRDDGYGANSGCTTFNNLSNGFTVENDGNTNLTVQLYSNVTAGEFIGIDSALFLWNVTLNESGSCVNDSDTGTGERPVVDPNTTETNGMNGAIFESVYNVSGIPITESGKVICPSLLFEDVNDALNIDINISLPVDAPVGDKLAGLVVTGTTET